VTQVSIVIPVWNGARFLGEALASARAQRWAPLEILVVDDGSSDGSAGLAAATPGVRVVSQVHAGVAAARNRGLAEARGELIAWLDADDRLAPDKLEVQAQLHLDRPELGFSFCHEEVALEPGQPRPSWLASGGGGPVYGTGAMVARAWAFARVGRFDERLTLGEDTDWILRALDLGVPMAVVPRALFTRRVHDGNLSRGRPPGGAVLLRLLRESIARKRGGGS
jgi:glycosyltransferase involved in cell wall biosynthesis